jgi:hypothetical protein
MVTAGDGAPVSGAPGADDAGGWIEREALLVFSIFSTCPAADGVAFVPLGVPRPAPLTAASETSEPADCPVAGPGDPTELELPGAT